MAHDFAKQSVVCYTLCRRCRENAVAAGEGRQENRAVLVWRGAASAGLFSSADRAYMKAPVPRPTLRLVDKVVCTPSSRQRNNLHFTHENPSCIPYGAGCYAASRRSWTSIARHIRFLKFHSPWYVRHCSKQFIFPCNNIILPTKCCSGYA